MKSRFFIMIGLAVVFLTARGQLSAHHGSGASYNMGLNKLVTRTGTVAEYGWQNPHVFITFDVTDDKGNVMRWGAETHDPERLIRLGWSKNTLKAGDEITVTMFPSKSGAPRGLLAKLVFNGKVLIDDGQSRNLHPDE